MNIVFSERPPNEVDRTDAPPQIPEIPEIHGEVPTGFAPGFENKREVPEKVL